MRMGGGGGIGAVCVSIGTSGYMHQLQMLSHISLALLVPAAHAPNPCPPHKNGRVPPEVPPSTHHTPSVDKQRVQCPPESPNRCAHPEAPTGTHTEPLWQPPPPTTTPPPPNLRHHGDDGMWSIASVGVGGTPRGRHSTCAQRDDCPALAHPKTLLPKGLGQAMQTIFFGNPPKPAHTPGTTHRRAFSALMTIPPPPTPQQTHTHTHTPGLWISNVDDLLLNPRTSAHTRKYRYAC